LHFEAKNIFNESLDNCVEINVHHTMPGWKKSLME